MNLVPDAFGRVFEFHFLGFTLVGEVRVGTTLNHLLPVGGGAALFYAVEFSGFLLGLFGLASGRASGLGLKGEAVFAVLFDDLDALGFASDLAFALLLELRFVRFARFAGGRRAAAAA